MKKIFIKSTLLGLFVLAISSCKDVKNDKPTDPLAGTAVDPMAGTIVEECSWRDKTLTGTIEVYLSDVKGKTKFVYASSGPL